MPAYQILFGAGFSTVLAVALGRLLLRALNIRLCRLESALFEFLSGAACLSVAVFALCTVGQATPAVFLAAGIPAILWAIRAARVSKRSPQLLPPAPLPWQVLFYSGIAFFATVYFVNALAPEASPDGSGYHLGNVLRMAQHHGFAWDYHSLYSYFPQGMEMLFLVAFSLGGHSAAALVHAAFLATLPLLMACFGRRFGFPRAAMAAGLLVFASPVVGLDGASAYNDVALATSGFAVLYLLQLNHEDTSANWLFLIGLLAGFCFGIKYTGCLAVTQAFSLQADRLQPVGRRLTLLAGTVITAGPWLLRNWIWLGNPIAPFFNRWFPNPYYHPGPEQSYLADLRHYETFHHWWQIPVDLSVRGGSISGILGPVFLLAPVALLTVRHPIGRKLLLAAALWSLPAWFNSGARFLIPSLPFLALAMGMALENSWGVLPAMAAFQLWACWPSNLAAYAAPWSWRIHDIPWQAAVRREPESRFLASRLPDYVFKKAIEQTVPPSQQIFSYAGRPEAYLPRTFVIGYESTLGLLVQDILAQAVDADARLLHHWMFPPLNVVGIRIVASKAAAAWWNIAAIQVAGGGREVTPSGWRFTASPNPWQAGLAFDESLATRWSSWQPLQPGFFVEADFPHPIEIASVALETGRAPEAHPLLEVATSPGAWQAIPNMPAQTVPIPAPNLRQDALNQLKMRGIFYLLMNDSDLPAADLKEHAKQWGVTLIQEAHATRFYRID